MTTFLSWYHLIASQVGVLLLGLLLGRWFWILAEGYRRKPIACLVEGDETIETDDEDEGGEDSPPPAFGFAEGRERGGMSSEREDGTSNPGDTTP
jgi:hypothetical protein